MSATTDTAPAPVPEQTKLTFRARRAAKRAQRMARIAQAVGPDVVASVEQQTADAQALAGIRGQERLLDPHTNPAVRPHADRLRDDEHRQELTARHRRMTRRIRVEDRRAAAAEETLQVLYAARRMNSPAESVLALHRARRMFLGITQAASIALSVGSATGPAALAVEYGAWAGVGYIAEIGLTGLSTLAVLYRAHLGAHGGVRQRDWRTALLWLLMIAPLAASITANAVTHGAVGVFCSIGAAAFATFAYLIGDLSSEALARKAAEVSDTDEAALRAVAMSGAMTTTTTTTNSAPADTDPAEVTEPPAQRVTVEREDEPRPVPTPSRLRVAAPKRLEIAAGTPRAMTKTYSPEEIERWMSNPRWETGERIFREALERGDVLSARKLTEAMGIKNRELAPRIIFYVTHSDTIETAAS